MGPDEAGLSHGFNIDPTGPNVRTNIGLSHGLNKDSSEVGTNFRSNMVPVAAGPSYQFNIDPTGPNVRTNIGPVGGLSNGFNVDLPGPNVRTNKRTVRPLARHRRGLNKEPTRTGFTDIRPAAGPSNWFHVDPIGPNIRSNEDPKAGPSSESHSLPMEDSVFDFDSYILAGNSK
jgi:hypothetical protein